MSRTDTEMQMVNTETGSIKRVPFASEAQMKLIGKLRAELNMKPLKSTPAMYQATKSIERLKQKLEKATNQQTLL